MTKKNQSKLSKEVNDKSEILQTTDISMDETSQPKQKTTIIGFDSDSEILAEINNRLSLANKYSFMIKKIPKNLTRISMKQMFPDMVTCRIPINKNGSNSGYAFIQMKTEEAAEKYIQLISENKMATFNFIAMKLKPVKEFKNLNSFDLKCLFYNGLKPDTKFSDIKSAYPNAKITFQTNKDKSAQGSFTLSFETEHEAKEAFAENKLTIHGVKIQLNYLIRDNIKEIEKEMFSFERPEELIAEIRSRFETLKDRSIVINNIDKSLTVQKLRELMPTLRSCKINNEKRFAFIGFDNSELALSALKEIKSKKINGQNIKAFIAKKPMEMADLAHFDLTSLHLSNLPQNITRAELESFFGPCTIDLPLNSDNTSEGSATLTFDCKEEALEMFAKTNVTFQNVPIDVNFKMETKSDSKRPNNQSEPTSLRKRKFSDNDDQESKVDMIKKIKIETKMDVKKISAVVSSKVAVKRRREDSDDGDETLGPVTKTRKSIAAKRPTDKTKSQQKSEKKIIAPTVNKVEKAAPKKGKKDIAKSESKPLTRKNKK